MTSIGLRRPQPGEQPVSGTGTTPAPADEPTWRVVLDWTLTALDAVPGWAWAIAITALFLIALRLRARVVAANAFYARRGKSGGLGRLLTAAIIAAALLWVAVLIGSFRGLVAFGRDTLHWSNGWEYLVPATLDGVAVVFAVFAFARVKRNRPVGKSMRIVFGATAAAAIINFWHEAHGTYGSTAGGAYLALLSVMSMAMLHELLDLFRDETGPVAARVKPVFGLRWVTLPWPTLCAFLAWTNHPPRPLPADAPADLLVWYGSVRHAAAHLETVRRAKRITRHHTDLNTAALPARWWETWLLPWSRNRALDATLTAERADHALALDNAQTSADRALADTAARHAAELEQVTAALAAEQAKTADLEGLLQVASDEAQRAAADAERAREAVVVAERDARSARAESDRVKTIAAGQVAAVQATAEERQRRIDHLDGQLAEARAALVDADRLIGQVRAEADEALSAARREHRAEMEATVARLAAEREQAVTSARAELAEALAVSAKTGARSGARRDRSSSARRSVVSSAHPSAETSADGSAGTSADTDTESSAEVSAETSASVSAHPSADASADGDRRWSPQQRRAFELRDTGMQIKKVAKEVKAGESTVRAWLAERRRQQQTTAAGPIAVPTTPLPAARPPAPAGINGHPINTSAQR